MQNAFSFAFARQRIRGVGRGVLNLRVVKRSVGHVQFRFLAKLEPLNCVAAVAENVSRRRAFTTPLPHLKQCR